MAADDKQIILDTKVLSLGKNELIEFALSLKIEGKSKGQIIKEIRNALEVNLSSFIEGDDKVNYLDGLISALNPETSKTGAEISEKQTEIQNLEKELSELEIKQKPIEDKLSHTKKSKIPEIESGSTTKISTESAKSPLVGLSSTILHRDFKIQGIIGQPSQNEKLGYQALMSQIETGNDKGYSDKEILTAVIRAVQPGMQLRSYLESVSGLTLPKLRKIL
jgi:chromosome segregation ATPase